MRAGVRWAIAVLIVVLVAGHILYWYSPRERAAVAEPGGLPGRMLAAPGFDACFWIPYPHQNLAALARGLGDWEGWVAAASRLAGLPPPTLPGFGPFAVPPASEVAVCSDGPGHRVLVGASIYPSIALIAKAAGRIAGNPWLAGGEVPDRERPTRVSWRGSEWLVSIGGADLPPAPPAPFLGAPALALLVLARPVASSLLDLPAGAYRLARPAAAPADLELALPGTAPMLPDLALPPADRPVLLAAAGAGWRGPAAGLALFPAAATSRLELPSAATFQPAGVPGRGRWSLPGGGLMGLLTGALPRGTAAGWSIVALDGGSLSRALALASGLAAVAPPLGPPAGVPVLRLGLWVEPAPARDLVASIRKLLEKVPLVSRREVDRWRDGETLLAPLARCRQLTLASAGPPDAFAFRLTGCR